MNIRTILQLINLVLAVASVLPSSALLKKLIKERALLVKAYDRELNRALTIVFGGVVTLAITNAAVALLAVLGIGRFAHAFSPFGRFITSCFFSIASWLIYFVDKENKW